MVIFCFKPKLKYKNIKYHTNQSSRFHLTHYHMLRDLFMFHRIICLWNLFGIVYCSHLSNTTASSKVKTSTKATKSSVTLLVKTSTVTTQNWLRKKSKRILNIFQSPTGSKSMSILILSHIMITLSWSMETATNPIKFPLWGYILKVCWTDSLWQIMNMKTGTKDLWIWSSEMVVDWLSSFTTMEEEQVLGTLYWTMPRNQ